VITSSEIVISKRLTPSGILPMPNLEVVCYLLIEAIQLGSFVVLEFGVGPVRLK
jgi:hypothetical protein